MKCIKVEIKSRKKARKGETETIIIRVPDEEARSRVRAGTAEFCSKQEWKEGKRRYG